MDDYSITTAYGQSSLLLSPLIVSFRRYCKLHRLIRRRKGYDRGPQSDFWEHLEHLVLRLNAGQAKANDSIHNSHQISQLQTIRRHVFIPAHIYTSPESALCKHFIHPFSFLVFRAWAWQLWIFRVWFPFLTAVCIVSNDDLLSGFIRKKNLAWTFEPCLPCKRFGEGQICCSEKSIGKKTQWDVPIWQNGSIQWIAANLAASGLYNIVNTFPSFKMTGNTNLPRRMWCNKVNDNFKIRNSHPPKPCHYSPQVRRPILLSFLYHWQPMLSKFLAVRPSLH